MFRAGWGDRWRRAGCIFAKSVGRDVYREVLRLNLLDFRLLRAARAEVRRRLALVPPVAACARRLPHRVKPSRLPWALRREEERNRRQGLFDAAFYLEKYPDVRAAGTRSIAALCEHGAAEGRKPHRAFRSRVLSSPAARSSCGRSGSASRFPRRRSGGCQSAPALRLRRRRTAVGGLRQRRSARPIPAQRQRLFPTSHSTQRRRSRRAFFEAVRADQLRA